MKFLKLFAILILSFAALQANAKTIRFAMVADAHYNQYVTSGKKGNATKALRCFVQRMNEQKPDFVMFLGDNIDKSKPQILKSFLADIKPIKRPYYILTGNRDTYKYSGLSREEFADIVSEYSPYQKKYSSNYVFYPTFDIAAVMVDSTSLGMPGEHGYFADNTLKWLDETLTKNKNKKVILFQHVPLIPATEIESHTILNEKEYKDVINKHNNIIMIASGHYHQFGAVQDDKGIYHIDVPELFEAPYEYVMMEITYDKKPFGKAQNFKFDPVIKQAL